MTFEATEAVAASTDGRKLRLRLTLEEAARFLPSQAPLGAFVHHNTLHAFEHLPFHEAVTRAFELTGAQPYASERFFRERIDAGRIMPEDLERALADAYREDAPLPAGLTLGDVRRLVLLYGIDELDAPALRWLIREEGLLDRYPEALHRSSRREAVRRSVRWLRAQLEMEGPDRVVAALVAVEDAEDLEDHLGLKLETRAIEAALDEDPEPVILRLLFGEARRLVGSAPRALPAPRRPRDRVLAATGADVDAIVHPPMIRLAASYLDAGLSYWEMPDRALGFYRAVRALGQHGPSLPAAWMGPLRRELARQERLDMDAEDAVLDCLADLGVPEDAWFETLRAKLLSLPGWAGMTYHLEKNPRSRLRALPYSLMDFTAVLLTFHRVVLRQLLGLPEGSRPPLAETLASLPSPPLAREADVELRAHALFCVLRNACLDLPTVAALGPDDGTRLLEAIEGFAELERRMVLQEGYEGHFASAFLDGLVANAKAQRALEPPPPRLQVAFCIDDREESLRRHLEELDPAIETYGALGYFGLAIAYTGLATGYPEPLCPVALLPDHAVHEVPRDPSQMAPWRERFERAGRFGFTWQVSARGTFRGFGMSVAGLLDAIPMIMRITAPRISHRLGRRLSELVLRRPPSRLTALRADAAADQGLPVGFTPTEAAERIAATLQDMGLVRDFAELVVILGHGATTTNNPHEAAYECGACGGRKGGANARLFADLVNRADVRDALAVRGVAVPATTWFVGGIHDTTSDAVELFDLDCVPDAHHRAVTGAIAALDVARRRNALERCRRFETLPLDVDPERALRHVEARSLSLAEPRPEYGHCTNAVCFIGRRWTTRGLFLDRRAFLVSYDPDGDPDGSVLERVLAAAGPVGAGINLEYYFSTVDNTKYGAGSKLPHNVTGLVGVMNGHKSDLRTGLPEQMVAIHEPMRLLVVVEASLERLRAALARLPTLARLVENRWIRLAAMDPETAEVVSFVADGLEPHVPRQDLPVYPSSVAYHHGRRDHLEPVRILAGLPGGTTHG